MRMSTAEFLACDYETKAKTRREKLDQPATGTDDEGALHKAILAECARRGWIAFHGSMAHKTFRTAGEFDMTILADSGRVFLVECKTRTGKLSPDQNAIHFWAKKLGHNPVVVRSFEQFLEIVK